MKSIFICLFMTVVLSCFGQTSCTIADTSKSWSHVAAGVGYCGVLGSANTFHIHFCGDSILSENRYLKVFQATDSIYSDDEMIGLLYEDTSSQQVFYRDLFFGNEGLIYDFSLESGDSIYIENWYYGSEALLVCHSIDSVIIDNQFVKKYFMREPWSDEIIETWIEGIGSMLGILNSGIYASNFTGGFRDFLCNKYNDTLILTNPIYQSCHLDEFTPQILSEYYDTAYLNTPYTFQIQISDTSALDSFEWIACSVPEDFNFDLETGTLEGFPTSLGSFGCVIAVTNGHNATDKLDKCLVVVNSIGINSSVLNSKIEISPNPCTDITVLTTGFPKENYIIIEVFNMNGKKMLEKTVYETSRIKIDCTSFPKGVYLVKMQKSKGQILGRKRFIKI